MSGCLWQRRCFNQRCGVCVARQSRAAAPQARCPLSRCSRRESGPQLRERAGGGTQGSLLCRPPSLPAAAPRTSGLPAEAADEDFALLLRHQAGRLHAYAARWPRAPASRARRSRRPPALLPTACFAASLQNESDKMGAKGKSGGRLAAGCSSPRGGGAAPEAAAGPKSWLPLRPPPSGTTSSNWPPQPQLATSAPEAARIAAFQRCVVLCRRCTRGSPSIRKLTAAGCYMHACKGEQAPARGLGERASPLGSSADLSYGALRHSYTNCAGRRPASAICAACSALHGRTTGARAASTASAPLTARRSWTQHAGLSFCTQPGPRGAAPGVPRTRTPVFLRWEALHVVPSTLFAH